MLVHVITFTGKRRSIELQQQIEAVELFNDFKRYKEERALLIHEMKDCLHYYDKVILPAISGKVLKFALT